MSSETSARQTATFAAGCFWGVEHTFRQTPGVLDARVGYTGGQTENPTYEQVCSGRTGHAEAVEVVFDPEQVSFKQLLEIFWGLHDPTQVNRQGPDVGSQYRSAIFCHTAEQQEAAERSKAALAESGRFSRPIATEIVPAAPFFAAEDYHQQYFAKKGIAPTCHLH